MAASKAIVIINPISGTNPKKDLPALFKKNIDKNVIDAELVFTKRAGHATEIAKKAVEKGIEKVIAVGGDGTINEVARALLHTETALGIIPSGSGNGLARHFKIPLLAQKAIQCLNTSVVTKVDSATINGHPFFCTAGIGFDAQIGQKFGEATTRGFKTYIKTTVTEFFSYKPQIYKLRWEDKQYESKAFLITFANTSQYGNNAFIAPTASTSDGKIDVCILKPFPYVLAPDLGRRLFSGSMHKSRYMKTFCAESVTIERETEGAAHFDGEPIILGKEIEIKCHPRSLKILLPV